MPQQFCEWRILRGSRKGEVCGRWLKTADNEKIHACFRHKNCRGMQYHKEATKFIEDTEKFLSDHGGTPNSTVVEQ